MAWSAGNRRRVGKPCDAALPCGREAGFALDLGHYDYGWWAKMDQAGCRIVTRFKSNTPLTVTAELEVPANGPILSDRIGLLPQRQAKSRKNPFSDPVREVRVRIETGKILRILCNDLNASAQEIADLYKRRWAIELFFRWVKQTLKIRHFLGNSENAVRIQIAVARLVRANLMHRKRIDRLIDVDPKPRINTNQMELQWA